MENKNNQNEPKGFSVDPERLGQSSDFMISEKAKTENKQEGPVRGEGHLPRSYNTDHLRTMVKNPRWGYVYWDFSDKTLENMKNELGEDFETNHQWVIRLYDISTGDISSAEFVDLPVDRTERHRFVEFGRPDTCFIAEMGVINSKEEFRQVMRSHPVITPAEAPADFAGEEEEWMIVNEFYEKIQTQADENLLFDELGRYIGENEEFRGYTAKFIGSSEHIVTAKLRKLQKRPLFENLYGRPSVSSFSASDFMKKRELREKEEQEVPAKKDFWMRLDCELIVYGATEPDASVEFMGENIELNEDGTFSFRFHLPDGNFNIPVIATSVCKDFQKEITPTVTRKTEYKL